MSDIEHTGRWLQTRLIVTPRLPRFLGDGSDAKTARIYVGLLTSGMMSYQYTLYIHPLCEKLLRNPSLLGILHLHDFFRRQRPSRTTTRIAQQ